MFDNQFTRKSVLTTAFAIGAIGAIGAMFSLSGCNSTSSNAVTPDMGIFIDAPVKGLQYSTTTQSGTTNDKGEFKYVAGEKVTFSIDGIDIGSVSAKAEVPITLLENYLDIARLLQSIDIDAREELIDISGIKIPDALKTQLINLLQNQQGTFDSILTQSQLDNIESYSSLQLAKDSPVSQSAAIQHIIKSISGSLYEQDFSRQTYINIDNQLILSFFADGSGVRYENDEAVLSETPFSWQVLNNELFASFPGGTIIKSSLLSADKNKHVLSSIDDDETIDETDIDTFYKAEPVSISDLDGKIISLDMSKTEGCSSQTFKFSGNSVNIVAVCTHFPNGIVEFPRAISNIETLEYAFQMSDGMFVDRLFLVEGDINSNGKVAIFGKRGNTIIEINVLDFTIVDQEASL